MKTLFDLPFEDPEPPVDPRPTRRVLTVTELTVGIRGLLEREFVEVWVEGEISNCRRWNTGHLYFTLKDGGAQMRAVMFRSSLRYLRFTPEDGLHVVARGRITVYEPKGEYQIVCEHMEPHGLGARQLAFDQLKQRLQAEGLFASARKRALPPLPRGIGIVTSLDGAALRDIIQVLGRRYPNLRLVVRPVRVQGDGSALEIAAGIRSIGQVADLDVLIVGRGGGSIEDLWAFNEEIVARAIAEAPIPVISAVGHEVDVTIADFVADLRAPTPSAAAELVVTRKDEAHAQIDRLQARATSGLRTRLQRLGADLAQIGRRPGLAGWPARLALRGRHVAELTHQIRHAGYTRLGQQARRLADLRRRLDPHDPGRRLGTLRTRLVSTDGRLAAAMASRRHASDARLRALAGRLASLSPVAVLGRGYALCWTADHTALVRDASTVTVGEMVHVTLDRGEIACQVRGAEPPTDPETP